MGDASPGPRPPAGGGETIPTMRAFVAVNLDLASVERLCEVAAALRKHPRCPEDARWVPPTRMHVTLKFLGDIDIGLAPAIHDAIVPLAETEQVIKVGFGALSGFPDRERARVVALILDDAGAVRRMAEAVEAALGKLGFDREAREFRPHVTLARLGRPRDLSPWVSDVRLPTEPATVTELALYRSDQSPGGHEYTALSRLGFLFV